MTQQEIQNLIERFLDAETTLQEEQQLMEYFRQEDIPEELMQYREMFLDYEALLPLPRGGEYTNTLSDSKVVTVELSREKQPPRIIRLWAVAASIAVLMVLGAGYLYNINNVEEKQQVAKVDPKPVVTPKVEVKPEAMPVETPSLMAATKANTPKSIAEPEPTVPATSGSTTLPAITFTHKSLASMNTDEYIDFAVAAFMPEIENKEIDSDAFNGAIRQKGMAMNDRINDKINTIR